MLDFIIWNASSKIFSIGGFALRWYGVLFALGYYIGYLLFKKFFTIEKVSIKLLDTLLMYIIISSLVGSRLGHCLFYEPEYYLKHPLDIIKPWTGEIGSNAKLGIQGLSSHGSAIGILLGIWLFARKYKFSFLYLLDRMVIVTALGGAFIRLGNLMNSEIVGKATDLPWGFIFVKLKDNVPRHPAQLYEAIVCILLFIFLLKYYFDHKGKIKEGLLLGWFLIILFITRFLIEFIKENQVDFESTLALNMGQILSIPFIILGIFLLFRIRNKQLENINPIKAKK